MGLSSRVAKETCNGAKIKSKVTASLYWLFHSISYADRAQTSESLIYSYPRQWRISYKYPTKSEL